MTDRTHPTTANQQATEDNATRWGRRALAIQFQVHDDAGQPGIAKESLRQQVAELLERVKEADGVAAFGEAFVQGMRAPRGYRYLTVAHSPARRSLQAQAGQPEKIIGVLGLSPDGVIEIAVDPDVRSHGVGSSLMEAVPDYFDVEGAVDVWAHGDRPDARDFAAQFKGRVGRELLKMSVSCAPGSASRQRFIDDATAARERAASEGLWVLSYEVAVAQFGKARVDEQWVKVNNEAFAWHPEQGGWDAERLQQARDTEWFDPTGVVTLWQPHRDGWVLGGFHWTKHVEGSDVGEVYVVCLADAARGQGWGTSLTALGLGLLVERGVTEIELYVEGDNAPALRTYEALGFEVASRDVVYRGKFPS